MIRTILMVLCSACAIVFALPWLILWSLIRNDQNLMYAVSMKVVRTAMWIAGVKVAIEGVENIPAGACVLAANHVSNIDPLALMPALPRRISVFIKNQVFRIPILSIGMRLVGFIPIDRENRESSADSFGTAAKVLKNGLPVLIFPEGSRSPDGRLRTFKRGAFVLAIRGRLPIIPVSISGTQYVLPRDRSIVKPGIVTIRIGPAVDAASYSVDRRPELTARIASLVALGLPESQRPVSS
jgi:1-acyl-sn-glycerol-3-phosphate acyltransferase